MEDKYEIIKHYKVYRKLKKEYNKIFIKDKAGLDEIIEMWKFIMEDDVKNPVTARGKFLKKWDDDLLSLFINSKECIIRECFVTYFTLFRDVLGNNKEYNKMVKYYQLWASILNESIP